jgi:hypothetical protein
MREVIRVREQLNLRLPTADNSKINTRRQSVCPSPNPLIYRFPYKTQSKDQIINDQAGVRGLACRGRVGGVTVMDGELATEAIWPAAPADCALVVVTRGADEPDTRSPGGGVGVIVGEDLDAASVNTGAVAGAVSVWVPESTSAGTGAGGGGGGGEKSQGRGTNAAGMILYNAG